MPKFCDRPQYTNVKTLSDGARAYYFNPPSWARVPEKKCPVDHTPLGIDKLAAYERATSVLLPMFYSWLHKDSELGGCKVVIGTFEWLMKIAYGTHRDFNNLADSTKVGHLKRIRTVCDLRMTDGSRLGDWPIKDFEPEVADLIYEMLLARHPVKIVMKENGKEIVDQKGLTDANHIIKLCVNAWGSAARSKSSIVPEKNPFQVRMKWKHKPTYKPTWDELCDFVEMADKMGYQDIATAVIVIWELHQRPVSVFGDLVLSHYRPDGQPNSILIYHGKTGGDEMWFNLFDSGRSDAMIQYEELAPRLEELAHRAKTQGRTKGLMIVRDYDAKRSRYRGWLGKGDSLRAVNSIVRKVVAAAGLDKRITLEAFRHGGITGMADADMTDAQMRIFTRHKRRLPTYIGPTQKQVRDGRKKINARRKETQMETKDRIPIPIAIYPQPSSRVA